MKIIDIMFSVHDYDHNGEIHQKGIFLHFGETRMKVADTLDEFKQVVERINGMVEEITNNYNI